MPLPPNASITDVINKLTELEGINQKTELASVIGSPALSTDTVAQQIVKLQSAKNKISNNLNSRGVISDNYEPIDVLADKINDVSYEISVSGTVTSTSNLFNFNTYGGGTGSSYRVTVSGLNFKPKRIVMTYADFNFKYFTEYNETYFDLTDTVRLYSVNTGNATGRSTDHYKGNGLTGYVNETGFSLPTDRSSATYTWIAYK